MTSHQITQYRLLQQQLAGGRFTAPAALVAWMGCIQAQDFAGAKWAIGSRIGGCTEAVVEAEYNEGRFLRTHVLRPTWHFVAPEDIRWMQLSAPRLKAFNKNLHRNLDITPTVLKRSAAIIEKALLGGNRLTRQELQARLQKAHINTDDIRFSFLLMDAELNGLICSGPRQGRQFTYALLEERVPSALSLHRQEALGELAVRYFRSRGPATLPDFAWWGGLTLKDAREGLERCRQQLQHEVVNGQAYWFSMADLPASVSNEGVYLLPAYDEYAIGYKDRSDILPSGGAGKTGNGIFKPIIVVGGKIAGVWQRVLKEKEVEIAVELLAPVSASARRLMTAAVKGYGKFLEKKVQVK